jgi:hypothetical protein
MIAALPPLAFAFAISAYLESAKRRRRLRALLEKEPDLLALYRTLEEDAKRKGNAP